MKDAELIIFLVILFLATSIIKPTTNKPGSADRPNNDEKMEASASVEMPASKNAFGAHVEIVQKGYKAEKLAKDTSHRSLFLKTSQ